MKYPVKSISSEIYVGAGKQTHHAHILWSRRFEARTKKHKMQGANVSQPSLLVLDIKPPGGCHFGGISGPLTYLIELLRGISPKESAAIGSVSQFKFNEVDSRKATL